MIFPTSNLCCNQETNSRQRVAPQRGTLIQDALLTDLPQRQLLSIFNFTLSCIRGVSLFMSLKQYLKMESQMRCLVLKRLRSCKKIMLFLTSRHRDTFNALHSGSIDEFGHNKQNPNYFKSRRYFDSFHCRHEIHLFNSNLI